MGGKKLYRSKLNSKSYSTVFESMGRFIHLSGGNIPHWCRKLPSVVTSKNIRSRKASIATLPFQVSELFVQPHSHTTNGGGNSLRLESYVANNSSTLPKGTNDCQRVQTFLLDHKMQVCNSNIYYYKNLYEKCLKGKKYVFQ